MKLTLPNNVTLEGTETQVVETAKKLGYGTYAEARVEHDPTIWHYSTTKSEWVKIESMNAKYLKNTVLKNLHNWVDSLGEINDPQKFVYAVLHLNDIHLAALLRALGKFWVF